MLPPLLLSELFSPLVQTDIIAQVEYQNIDYPNKYNYNTEKVIQKSLKFNMGTRICRTYNKTITHYNNILFSYKEPIAQCYYEGSVLKGVFVYNKTRQLRGTYFSSTTSKHINKLVFYLNRYAIPYRFINDDHQLVDKKNKPITLPSMENDSYIEIIQDEIECPICINTQTNEVNIKLRPCGHKFHLNCINNWLKQKKECPLCKTQLSSSNLTDYLKNQIPSTYEIDSIINIY
tara:strand:- start:46 stop:744 length:699 start_codon:yes stop_codon:yes gene_type:complete